MNSLDSIFNEIGVVAVWLTGVGFGVMIGNFVAVVLRRPAKQRSEWTALGAALGCVIGFFAMVGEIAISGGL
jgi:F0F1-type ATP synthase membrane subunit c/vacuolar-type H+-ATPase subunit K